MRFLCKLLLFLILYKYNMGGNNDNDATESAQPINSKWKPRQAADKTSIYNKRMNIDQINQDFLIKNEALRRKTIRIRLIGKSFLKKDIYAMEIQHSFNKGGTVFIDGGLHGNEWESVNFALYIIDTLLSENMGLLLWLRVVILPLANPDGYEVAEKNTTYHTNVNKDRLCPGVDIARNFEVGTPPDFLSCNTYQGSSYFSEPESINIKRYFDELGDIKLYISLHSGKKQFIGYPYADIDDPHNSSMMAKNMHAAISSHTSAFKNMEVGSLTKVLGEKYGGSVLDWAAMVKKVQNCILVNLGSEVSDKFNMFESYFQGIRVAIMQLQITDEGVALAFARECMSKTASPLTLDSDASGADVLNFSPVQFIVLIASLMVYCI